MAFKHLVYFLHSKFKVRVAAMGLCNHAAVGCLTSLTAAQQVGCSNIPTSIQVATLIAQNYAGPATRAELAHHYTRDVAIQVFCGVF